MINVIFISYVNHPSYLDKLNKIVKMTNSSKNIEEFKSLTSFRHGLEEALDKAKNNFMSIEEREIFLDSSYYHNYTYLDWATYSTTDEFLDNLHKHDLAAFYNDHTLELDLTKTNLDKHLLYAVCFYRNTIIIFTWQRLSDILYLKLTEEALKQYIRLPTTRDLLHTSKKKVALFMETSLSETHLKNINILKFE